MITDPGECIKATIRYWHNLPMEVFVPLLNKKTVALFAIKFRNVSTRKLFNDVQFLNGITFTDVMGPSDLFAGEFVRINKRLFKIISSKRSIILSLANAQQKKKKIEKIRDDGFLKTYRIHNGTTIITII